MTMTFAQKMIQNSGLSSSVQQLSHRAGEKITHAIKQASLNTGVDFAYLLQQANVESSFNAQAKAGSSSATGLFQFIESTWLSMIDKHGAKYGLGDIAAKIDTNGKVSDKQTRAQILNMRKDPAIASSMAAEYAAENRSFLENRLGSGNVGSTEMYMAHFMGAGGASAFLQARQESPTTQASLLFPQAAKSNYAVFYDQATGRPKTLDEVYQHFDQKFAIADSNSTNDKIYQNIMPQEYTEAGPRVTKTPSHQYKTAPSSLMFIEETAQWVDIKTKPKGFFGPSSISAQMASLTSRLSNPVDVMSLAALQWPNDRDNNNSFFNS